MLIPHRTPDVEESVLPPDYQRSLAAVRQAAGPVMARQVGEMLGLTGAHLGGLRLRGPVKADDPARHKRFAANDQ
jgi:hypothetical protein